MLKDIPYSKLKQDGRAYEIMLLRDQYNNIYADIAKEYKMSVAWVTGKYNKLKVKQIGLYINHISIMLGYQNNAQIRKIFDDAYECYQDRTYACAYLEKQYKDILTEYRDGEPGMPVRFIKSMPPFKPNLSKKTIARVIEMREVQQASFVTIAKKLRMTQAKAKHAYEMFYHEQVWDRIKILEEKAGSVEERDAVWHHYSGRKKSYKKIYDLLIKENPFL